MIIWINGAFGSGKTNVAYELNRRIESSYVYDPEEIGYFIRDNIPKELKLDDFQDFPIWRDFNYQMLEYMSKHYNGIIIVPMTMTSDLYYNEILERLRQRGVNIKHFTLMADKEILIRRLRKRGDGKNSWAAKQIDRCINSLDNPIFKEHIDTNKMTVYEVVDYIGKSCRIDLLPDNRNLTRKKLDKFKIWVRHIRLLK
ncbi:AAA family ATPase [Tissierella carlieri]|jgi:RNase adaptor protein for sRNA GlmZ degradation|uniref:AAA family ATPase n=1 Tax=Tissierella carlieri TaxID=689904 RepID=UPI001C11770F|nr:AAA family ATPase [Tissierella carlieri]MBU5311718.1 AAA family ATPase [Tissierella carlieri]MDU5080785.1 AAA family ATPase [Bacillota bacterium]